MNDLQDALTSLPEMLKASGLPQDGWTPSLLSRRNDKVMHRVVVGLSHPSHGDLVLKRVFRPVSPTAFSTQAARQIAVAKGFSDCPSILAVDEDQQTILMHRLPGQTLFDLCAFSPMICHADPLRRAGAWTDRFHRAFGISTRQFQPRHAKEHLGSVLKRIERREVEVPRRKLFLQLADAVLASAPGEQDCGTVAAISHGDLNCRNIVLQGDAAAGLDFGPGKLLPVGHDLARLFCHYGALCVSEVDQKKGRDGPLPGVDLSAFFAGYEVVPMTDRTVRFLTLVRLLRDWQQMPKNRINRSLAQTERLTGIARLAKAALFQLTEGDSSR